AVLSLARLEHPAHARIAIVAQNAQHVAVQVWHPVFALDPWYCEEESGHAVAVKRPEGLASDRRRYHEERYRQEFQIVKAPDDFLKMDGLSEFFVTGQGPDRHN